MIAIRVINVSVTSRKKKMKQPQVTICGFINILFIQANQLGYLCHFLSYKMWTSIDQLRSVLIYLS